MPEMSFRLPEEWARAVAARVARTIRNACGQEADKNADVADQIDDACDAAVSATLQVLAEEFNGRDRLHDDTALATAVARARREALEEAKTACLDLSDAYRETGEHHMGVGPKGPDPVLTKAAEALAWARGATECAHALTKLAATPPEDRQTETGWKPPAGWKLVPEEPTEEMDAAARIMCHQMSGVIDPVVHVWDAMLAAAPPPPAIGSLEGEGPSHG